MGDAPRVTSRHPSSARSRGARCRTSTHGRSFWILDDIAPLRQLAFDGQQRTALYKPSQAWRVRWTRWPDTPLPPDEPTGANPPDGAIIDYSLATAASTPVVLEILDRS